jgi:general secretion pathway protein B
MSYILDALRKADAQRERDPARGIHAQPVPAVALPATRPMWPVWLVAAVVVGAGLLLWARQPAPSSPPAPQAAAVQGEVTLVQPALPVPAQAVQPAAPPPLPAPAQPVAATSAQPPARVQTVAAPVQAPPAVPAAAPMPAAPAPAAAGAAAPPDARVLAFAELPQDVQRDLPKLAISGGVHSDNVAQRMLIVGGQVYNEGSEIAPGVVLEQVRPKTAVLRYRSWRYSVGY